MNTKFATARITGGPIGRNVRLEIDGAFVDGAYRLSLLADTHDLVRLTVDRFAVIEVELEGGIKEEGWIVELRQPADGLIGYDLLARTEADTISEALTDLAKQMKAQGR